MKERLRQIIGLLVLQVGVYSAATGQFVDRNAEPQEVVERIAGVSVLGSYGLVHVPTPDVLPKGGFVLGWNMRGSGGPSSATSLTNISLGLGLASLIEGYGYLQNTNTAYPDKVMLVGVKGNTLPQGILPSVMGSVDLSYLRVESYGDSGNARASVHSRLLASVLVGDVELAGIVGLEFPMTKGIGGRRPLWGLGAMWLATEWLAAVGEVSTPVQDYDRRTISAAAGVKLFILEHIQVLLSATPRLAGSTLESGFSLGISIGSSTFGFSPGQRIRVSPVPPLPSLEDLRAAEN